MEFLLPFVTDIDPGRLSESLIFLGVLWWKFKPHLTKMESEITLLRKSVSEGFAAGEQRFERLENRVANLENKTKE